LPKSKSKALTVAEVKKMIYKEIPKKQMTVDPEKFNMRIVEDNLAGVEAIQQIYAMILDEELRRKRGISLPEKPEEMQEEICKV
jgi:hypothetical protein